MEINKIDSYKLSFLEVFYVLKSHLTMITYLYQTSKEHLTKQELHALGYTDFFTLEEEGTTILGAHHSAPVPPQPQSAILIKTLRAEELWSTQWELFSQNFDGVHAHYDLKHYGHPASLPFSLTPGQSFGDGHHETTTLMLQALCQNTPSEPVLIDLGSGSGILSIAALLLAPGRTLYALEIDPPSIAHTQENLTLNQLQAHQNLSTSLDTPSAILVNMLPHEQAIALPLTLQLAPHTTTIIASGILQSAAHTYLEWLFTLGFSCIQKQHLGQWCVLLCKKNPGNYSLYSQKKLTLTYL